jgi:hypothetical protein
VYRPPSSQPKGAWARHLHEQRRARDLSATQAFELVYERIGWSAKSRTAYVAIDSGDRQPKENEAAVLAEEFGWPPEADDPIEAAQGDVVAAIQAQTRAIEANTEMLRTVLERLGGLTPDPAGGEALTAYAQRSSGAAETPQVPSQPPADRQEEVSR